MPLGRGRLCEVTVLFADVRGFTRLTAQRSPQEVVTIMNQFFQQATEILLDYDACIDKFMGDQIMVVFGAPFVRPDHAQQGLEAALAIQRASRSLPGFDEDPVGLALGMGLHTGEALVGNVGAQQVKDFTAMGTTVNIAAHLQRVAGAGEILVTDATAMALAQPLSGCPSREVYIEGVGGSMRVNVLRTD